MEEEARSWDDALAEVLTDAHGEEAASRLLQRYGTAFTSAYREEFSPGMARIDIDRIERSAVDRLRYQPLPQGGG